MEQMRGMCRDSGQTLIVVTHDEKIAGRADRVVRLEDGEVIKDERREADIRTAGGKDPEKCL